MHQDELTDGLKNFNNKFTQQQQRRRRKTHNFHQLHDAL